MSFPDTYTHQELMDDVAKLMQRSRDAEFVETLPTFIRMARAYLVRRLVTFGSKLLEESVDFDILTGATSVAAPAGLGRIIKMKAVDTTDSATDPTFIQRLFKIDKEKYDRLTDDASVDNPTTDPLVVGYGDTAAGIPRLYAVHDGVIYFYPAVDNDTTRLVLDHYAYPPANISTEGPDYSDSLFKEQDLMIAAVCAEAASWLQDADQERRWVSKRESLLMNLIQAHSMEVDVPEGEYRDDRLQVR